MTSRVSFLKLIVETLRRHTAAVLITVLGFFIHIVTFFMNVQNILSSEYISSYDTFSSVHPDIDDFVGDLCELCSPNLTNGIIAMIFGAYLAFDFLRYMHSKRETDFYDSMPIRRQTWFKTLFTSCFALFFVLCAITIGIEIAIVFGTGYGSLGAFQNMLWNFICMVAAFLVTWFTTALAMVMTGHSIIAFLGVGVFASYIPLILVNLIPVYSARFFETYVYSDLNPNVYYFSPVTLVYKMTKYWLAWTIGEHWTYIIGCFVYTIVIGIITYLLFLKRPSEAAGRAMAFEKANSAIRFMLVIPLALYAGLFLEEMATMTSGAWLIFGVAFGAFLLHGIMECIFQFDIRALLSKKKQLLVAILFCLAFVFIFCADFLNYDDYLPDANDVKMVKIESHLFGYRDDTEWFTKRDWLQGELIDDAIAVAKDIKNAELPSDDEYYYMDYVTFTYTMKNGRKVQRAYSYDANKAPESLSNLYANPDFKDDYCVLYNLEQEDITLLSINNGVEQMSLNLSEEELNEFVDIYIEEYTTLELSQLLTDAAVYRLRVEYKCDGGNNGATDSYSIYPTFTKTLAFLKEKGVVSFYESENITLTNMEIFDYYQGEDYDSSSLYISDIEQLNELKQYMMINEFKDYVYSDDYLYAEVEVKSETGINYISVSIRREDVNKILEQ